MARRHPKHPGFRTKDQLVHDVAFVLNAPLHYGTKLAVLDNLMWSWTEFDGKYEGCRYWSKLAFLQRHVDPKAKFRHEHVVPKAIIIKMLFDVIPATPERVRETCERYLIGVVVTLPEDGMLNAEFGRTMPPEFFEPSHPSFDDPWIRYRRYGIEVVSPCGEPVPDIQPMTLEQLQSLT